MMERLRDGRPGLSSIGGRRSVAQRTAGPVACALLAMFAGCTVGPDYSTPPTTTPEDFGRLNDQPQGPSRAVAGPADLAQWWSRLNDPELDALIDRAIASNLDLKLATSRVREARAVRGFVASAQYPTVDATAGYTRSRESENVGPNQLAPQNGDGQDLFQVGFDAGWELDVFGGVRRAVEAADADVQAAEEGRRDVLVTLIAEVARSYVEVRTFQRRLDIARRNVKASQDSVDLSNARFLAGLTGELDVAQARALLQTRLSQIPPLEIGAAVFLHRLGVLLGAEPLALRAELTAVTPIPATPAEVPVGLPSELLRRRPDIRRAERQLAAATARVGAATADLYPRFALTGAFVLQSDQIGTLFDMNSRAWGFTPSMRWNLFDAGRVRSNIAVKDALTEQALTVYEQTVLNSLEETENALVSFAQEQSRRESLTKAVEANTRAVDLANQLYSSGLKDFLNVLASQQQLFESEDQLAQSDRAVTSSLIALYKALGGGWEHEPAANPPAEHEPGAPGATGKASNAESAGSGANTQP